MNTLPEPYILVTRADLTLAHVVHRNGSTCLCVGAKFEDWVKVEAGEKPLCKICMQEVEDREYRSRWVRDGGWSIYRGDEHNVHLLKDGTDEPLYYPDVPSALTGMFRRMIDPGTRSDLKSHAAIIANAEARIVEAANACRSLFDG